MFDILCLKIDRNQGYSGITTICVFSVDDYLNITEAEKEMILNTIQNEYSWLQSELSMNIGTIKHKLLNSKWKSLEYQNKDFNCTGRLFLEKINCHSIKGNINA